MSQIINDLATIEISNDILQQLNVSGIYSSFTRNYQKLDNLKNFRSNYEKKNALARWWHNDKLNDAQMDSAEVQAEFSKTIGQLMMISIMQSKELSVQQTQLNSQQTKLKLQADGIAAHADELQKQHSILANQSEKLENLVREYFDLKGLTEDGAEKLIKIATEIKATKESLLQEFSVRTREIENQCGKISLKIDEISIEAAKSIKLNEEKIQLDMAAMEKKSSAATTTLEEKFREAQLAAQQSMIGLIEKQAFLHQESRELQIAKNSELNIILNELQKNNQKNTLATDEAKEKLASWVISFNTLKAEYEKFKRETSSRINRLIPTIALTATVTATIVGGAEYIFKLV